MRTGSRVLVVVLSAWLALADGAWALTYVNLMDEPSAEPKAPRQRSQPREALPPEPLPAEPMPEGAAAAPEPLPEPLPESQPARPPEPPRPSSLRRGVASLIDAPSSRAARTGAVPEPTRPAAETRRPAARARPRSAIDDDELFDGARDRLRTRSARRGTAPRTERAAAPAPSARSGASLRRGASVLTRPAQPARASAPAARPVAAGPVASRGTPALRPIPPPPPARPAPPERRKAWASAGLYLMSYKSDVESPLLADPRPGGGGNIQNLEVGLGGPYSLGYSRIGILGDLPGAQSDVHVNYALPDGWLVQVGASMGEIAQRPGGPLRNDFTGTTYSILKAFRISPQWRFQASYTNVPVRDYQNGIQRAISSRLGYHLFTVSYSPSKAVNTNKMAIDAGILRLTDIRPIGFNYLYAGISYRFQVPAVLR